MIRGKNRDSIGECVVPMNQEQKKAVSFSSIETLFQVGTEYEKGELCVKEKDVPYAVAGSLMDRMRRKQ